MKGRKKCNKKENNVEGKEDFVDYYDKFVDSLDEQTINETIARVVED